MYQNSLGKHLDVLRISLHHLEAQAGFEQISAKGLQELHITPLDQSALLIHTGRGYWHERGNDPLSLLGIAIGFIEPPTNVWAKADRVGVQHAIVDNLTFKWQENGLCVDRQSETHNLLNRPEQSLHTIGVLRGMIREKHGIGFKSTYDIETPCDSFAPTLDYGQIRGRETCGIGGNKVFK